jgi:hypothetical protein
MAFVRPPLTAIVTGLAIVAVGCGGGDDKEGKNAKAFDGDKKAVAQAIDDLVSASHDGDAQKICTELFTPGLAKAIGTRNKSTCIVAVKKQLISPTEDITVTDVRLQGSNALVTVREQNKNVTKLSLVDQGQGWRINAIQ